MSEILPPSFGTFDNRECPFYLPDHIFVRKSRNLNRRLAQMQGRSVPLYLGGGLHLQLPVKKGRAIYLYIRKNGCSAFKNWLLEEGHGKRESARIGALARQYQVTQDEHLNGCRILVLRDPSARLCSLFRNKLVQRRGSEDIVNNIKQLTGQYPESMTFRKFIFSYIYPHLNKNDTPKIDRHCATQYSHLWPILYDRVILLQDLPSAAIVLFGEKIAEKYFAVPANPSSVLLTNSNAVDVPAAQLQHIYSTTKALPSDESLLDDELRQAIASIYLVDYKLIAMTRLQANPQGVSTATTK